MKKFVILTGFILLITSVNAQFLFRSQPGERYNSSERNREKSKFQPKIILSFGYGFPNLDQYQLLSSPYSTHTSVNQTGPVWGTLDYQFNRAMSVGVMVSYGKVNAPYYNSDGSGLAFTGYLKSTSIMVDFVRYLSGSEKVVPYIRTAIGINLWTQDYLDQSGNVSVFASDPSVLAYQASIGVKFNVIKQSGVFLEAGYGKYILSAGLSFKFN